MSPFLWNLKTHRNFLTLSSWTWQFPLLSVLNSCLLSCDLFIITEIFFENLSSNLATITRNLSVISSTLQKSFKIIFMNWNNSCESCYTHKILNFKISSTCRLVQFLAPKTPKCARYPISRKLPMINLFLFPHYLPK